MLPPKIRVFELAKELNVDSKRVMEILQTFDVDVKNHMSTIDQKAAEKVTETVKKTSAKKSEGTTAEVTKTARPAAAAPPKPAREANPAKASLLDDFFGAGTKRPQRVEDMKREMRSTAERAPAAERPPAATRSAGAERPAAAQRPAGERSMSERLAGQRPAGPAAERPVAAQRPAAPAERAPGAERPARVKSAAAKPEAPAAEAVAPAPKVEAAPAPKAEAPVAEAAAPKVEAAPQVEAPAPKHEAKPVAEAAPEAPPAPKIEAARVAEAPAAHAEAPAPAPAAVEPAAEAQAAPPVAAEVPADGEATDGAAGPATLAGGPTRALPAGPSRPLPAGPRAAGPAPRPAAGLPTQPTAAPATPGPTSGLGLPTRPVPAAERAALEGGPRPAGQFEGPRPAGQRPSSGLGLPMKPVPGQTSGLGAPRPAGAGGFGPRPAGPGGFDRGPRPGGPRFGADAGPGRPAVGGGFGGPSRGRRPGGTLNIPKVDPKVAEAAKPAENKRPIGQGGDRKKGDAFTKRETAASRPSEEKLFGRRPGGGKSSIVERRQLRGITIEGALTVKDLAHEMGVTAAEVIKKLLTGFGIMATINQELDTDTCVLVAGEFGVEVQVKEVQNVLELYDTTADASDEAMEKESRHPVVTIMGHVDHGKTSLLDAIRSAKVAVGEAGGITQHIGAYEVELKGRKITFLDTPGHEAFTAMRARGANVTDIAVLVVAADDSVMPQTIESINHAKAAGVPVLVAINKIDKPGADPSRVKQDLTAHGLVTEEWGGETIMVPVSAKQQTNLDLLLENILILADVLELQAVKETNARGTVLEAQLDKNRGPVATVLVQAGTLNAGDVFVAGSAWGRVRAMFDHRGRKMKSAGPSTPVQILGFQTVPAAGDVFRVAPDEKTAREIAEKRLAKVAAERQGTKAMSLDDFMSKVKEGEVKDLNLIVKADVQGSAEAVRGQLEKLRNEEVQVKIVHAAVGAVTESDVMLASASGAIIIGFNVRPDDRASRAAQDQGIDVRLYNVIYNIVDDIKAALTGMLAPKIEESILGRAEVRETFKVPKVGMAAGCMVVSGKVTRNAKYRLIRDGVVIWHGEINALRRFKDEVRDVAEGYECGITLEKFQDFKPGDILEAYELKEVKAG